MGGVRRVRRLCRAGPGDRAASTEDTDLKKPGGEAQKLGKAGWGWVGSPTSAPWRGRALFSAVWAVHSYTFPCAAPARHRLGTMRHRRRTRTRRSQVERHKSLERQVGGGWVHRLLHLCRVRPSFCLSGQCIPTLSPVLPPGQAQAGDRAASTEDTDPKKLEKAGSLRSFGSSGFCRVFWCALCATSQRFTTGPFWCALSLTRPRLSRLWHPISRSKLGKIPTRQVRDGWVPSSAMVV